MNELLIIKGKDDYYRFKDGGYHTCELNKASVFPLEQVKEAKRLCSSLSQDGVTEVSIRKLTIKEEPYVED